MRRTTGATRHYRVTGPAVAQLQATFVEHWLATKGVVLQGAAYFPELAPTGNMAAQMVRSAVDDGSESIRLMYLTSIAAARKSVLLANAYFVPDDLSVQYLDRGAATGRGRPADRAGTDTDTKLTQAASRRRWGRLLEAGVVIHQFQPTMYHCKVMIVDDRWVSVGSTNFDNRSFHLNSEANLNVLDEGFARAERRTFEQDRLKSRRMSLEDWRRRPRLERVGDRLADLFGSQL